MPVFRSATNLDASIKVRFAPRLVVAVLRVALSLTLALPRVSRHWLHAGPSWARAHLKAFVGTSLTATAPGTALRTLPPDCRRLMSARPGRPMAQGSKRAGPHQAATGAGSGTAGYDAVRAFAAAACLPVAPVSASSSGRGRRWSEPWS
jgi:hypothetical protein